MPHFVFLDELRASLAISVEFQELSQKIQQNPSSYPDYKLSQWLLFHKGKIWVDKNLPFKICSNLITLEFFCNEIVYFVIVYKNVLRKY